MEVRIDPRDFILAPYWECPKCHKPEAYGVLSVRGNSYTRRCKECRHTEDYGLPPLDKKVIYLDQFAISNIMKSLNPKTKANKRGRIDKFWSDLFDKIYILCRAQLMICPYSDIHECESVVTPYSSELRRAYELFSHGVSFLPHKNIEFSQVYKHAEKQILGIDSPLNKSHVIVGGLNEWQERIIITVRLSISQEDIDGLRKVRDSVHEGLSRVFARWQQEHDKKFMDWYNEEVMAYGQNVIRRYHDYYSMPKSEIDAALRNGMTEKLQPPMEVAVFNAVQQLFLQSVIPESETFLKTEQYFLSSRLQEIPSLKISAMLLAAIARKAAAGQKKTPTQGIAYDIAAISSFLPCCDAMFIDNECDAYLHEHPLCDELNYGTKTFSLNTRDAFVAYLDEVSANAPNEHMKKVVEVYGEKWNQPYRDIYLDDEKRRKEESSEST
jgi:hypothetical protein